MVKEAQKGRPPQKGSLSEGWLPAQSMDAMIPDTYGSATFNKYKLYVRLPSVELLMKTEFFWKSYRDLITLEKAAFFTQKGSWPDVGPYVVLSLWERGAGFRVHTAHAPGHGASPAWTLTVSVRRPQRHCTGSRSGCTVGGETTGESGQACKVRRCSAPPYAEQLSELRLESHEARVKGHHVTLPQQVALLVELGREVSFPL